MVQLLTILGTRLVLDDEDPGEDENSAYKCCQGNIHVKVVILKKKLKT